MSKLRRKVVPSALHSELSEYSSLLRALRTTHTLDLSSHLAQSQQASPPEPDTEEDGEEDVGETERLPSEPLSRGITPNHSSKSGSVGKTQQKSSETGKRRVRDLWTRWPLLADDVHVPQWGLEDEIKYLATHSLKHHVPDIASQIDGDAMDAVEDSNEDDEDSLLSPSFLSSLTLESSQYLSQVLAALVAHTPLAEKSMQNRIKPMGWNSVLDIVSASGLVDETIAESVQHRMEAIYGPSHSIAVSRLHSMASTKQKLHELASAYDLSFLSLPSAPIWKPGRKKRKQKRESTIGAEPNLSDDDEQASPKKRIRSKYQKAATGSVTAAASTCGPPLGDSTQTP